MLESLERGDRVRRVLDLHSGAVTMGKAQGADVLTASEAELISVHGPCWRILIVGAGR